MNSFIRMLKYVWSQWNRIIIISICALIAALLYSLSFATISPLLTVMMGQEGLHGWANRRINHQRYGVNFYIPEGVVSADPNSTEISYGLRIIKIKKDGLADRAGLKAYDLIIGTGSQKTGKAKSRASTSDLLEELAKAEKDAALELQVQRTEGARTRDITIDIKLESKPFYSDVLHRLLSFAPGDNTINGKERTIVFIVFVMALVTLVRCLSRFCQDYTVRKVVNTSLAHLREDAFEHVLTLPLGYFTSEGASDTVSKFVRDTAMIGDGINYVLGKLIREPLKAVALLLTAMIIDYKLSLIFMCSAPFGIFILTKFGQRMKKVARKSLESWARMLCKLEETIRGISVVKVYNQQQYEHADLQSINRRLLKQQFRIAKISAATDPVMEILGMLAASAGIIFGAHWVFSESMDTADFLVLLFCLGGVAEAIRRISPLWVKLQHADAACERVFGVVDAVPEVEPAEAFELEILKDRIEFKDIFFSYPGTDRPVLNGIGLTIKAGQNIALVGPNGSGKTTLINLIPRFYDPCKGGVLIDGRDIKDATLHSLRNQIGMVTQNVVTFNNTIAANIAYGKPQATRDEIILAAKRAFVHEFVTDMPDGYETVIGEDGAGLSGGQLQRIIIARAILKNPPILIFDEATSQVDADSEAKIHNAIEDIMKDRTTILIAHRFSTVIAADKIVVMDNGKIIAQGSHEQLARDCHLYQSLYETQLIKA